MQTKTQSFNLALLSLPQIRSKFKNEGTRPKIYHNVTDSEIHPSPPPHTQGGGEEILRRYFAPFSKSENPVLKNVFDY